MNTIVKNLLSATGLSLIAAASNADNLTQKQIALGLLEIGIAKGDRNYIISNVIESYRQHNPQVADGRAGLLSFLDVLQTFDPPVQINPIRILADDKFVVIHQKAEVLGSKVAIDLLRFENGKIVEHWDAIQEEVTDTENGRSMTGGVTKITDLEKTAENKALVIALVTDVLMHGEITKLDEYITPEYQQHSPFVADKLSGLKVFFNHLEKNNIVLSYKKLHNVVAEGNFVFTQAEGIYDNKPTAFYDIWRVEDGMIAEHWDVVQQIPSELMHDNGMF